MFMEVVHGIAADEGKVVRVGGLQNDLQRPVEVVAGGGWHLAQPPADRAVWGLPYSVGWRWSGGA
jgi:hypothetical protein